MSVPTSDRGGIQQAIRALRAGGFQLSSVFDGEEDIPVSNETEAIEAIMAVDQAHLHVTGPCNGWVFFVLGNDPEEVICDHTVNLEHVLGPLIDKWISD